MSGLGDFTIFPTPAGKTNFQSFYASSSSTLQALAPMWCFDCPPGAGFPGSASGGTVVQATAAASGTITIPATTDTLIAKATTDTLTNKTYDTAGAGNSFKIAGTAVTALSGTGGTLCTSIGSACASGGGGGLPTKIFGGTKALSASALSSATCRVETLAATGTLTTDNILANFNANTDAVTGYAPTTGGILVVKAYPTADTVNFSVCNNTGLSITPGATTVNVIVMRGGFFTGTKALSTSLLTSATCRVETLSATGTLTTDTINTSFNANTDAVTGYDPTTGGMLTLKVYPTADTINVSVCNNTASSITPGAVTLNAQILR
jgi:hypothetical protein